MINSSSLRLSLALVLMMLSLRTLHAQIDSSNNLITNGNFAAGYTGFQSDYQQWMPWWPAAMDAGYYSLSTDLSQHSGIYGWSFQNGHNGFSGYNGSQYYLFANGATDTTQSPWYETLTTPSVALTTDANAPVYYRFEAMVANTDPAGWAPPSLSFEINLNGSGWNQLTLSPDLSVNYDTWTLVYADGYFTNTPTSVGLRLRNASDQAAGNDFAVDNLYFGLSTNTPSYLAGRTNILSTGDLSAPISLGAVPEPSTYALFGLGALGGIIVLRRCRAA